MDEKKNLPKISADSPAALWEAPAVRSLEEPDIETGSKPTYAEDYVTYGGGVGDS